VTPPGTAAPVVIVGAGPVGLLLACELGRARVPVVVVERLAEPMTESRAGQLTTLTAELLHERGFDALLDEAVHEPRGHFAGLGFDASVLDSEFAGNWKVPQYRTEAALGERAVALGATLLRAHELTEITERADHVVCGVEGPGGPLRIQAEYVVGCDGARSTVRRLCGFPVSATAPTRELLRADVTGISIRDRRFERLEAGFAVAATRDGVTRVMVHAAGQAPAERTGPPRFGEVVRLWEKVTGEDISGGNAIWLDSFDNTMGQARSYRRGRVLLAGDAAHWHMPIGGQALNVGLQDAVNLGWKLAGTVRGWAAAGLLDGYHDERHPVAARVLDQVAAQEILLLGGAEIEPLRAVLTELTGLDEVRAHLASVAGNLGDRYGPPGPRPIGHRITGYRLRAESGPLRAVGTEPVLVRLTPPSGVPGRFPIPTIHAIDEKDSLPGITTILLRPDGYVAWAGDGEDDLDQAIGKLCAEGRKENARL
jgi:2-polyprenyl-6-methoxyphenol hydroxylase-like FAD-dependent oxidoreductase